MLAALNPKLIQIQQKPSIYQKMLSQLDFDDFEFPMLIGDVPRCEKIKKISINAFSLENNKTDRLKKVQTEKLFAIVAFVEIV